MYVCSSRPLYCNNLGIPAEINLSQLCSLPSVFWLEAIFQGTEGAWYVDSAQMEGEECGCTHNIHAFYRTSERGTCTCASVHTETLHQIDNLEYAGVCVHTMLLT